MARQPRFYVEGQTLHVVQRAVDRRPIFHVPRDCEVFLSCLTESARTHGLEVHAYVLMTNHWHLLATPTNALALPKAIQCLGRRYVRYFNDSRDRTGTLWEGRYKAALIDSERYLLTCMRYIELNPVRAGIVSRPNDYEYSSYSANTQGARDELLTPHFVYTGLGASAIARQAAYRALFDETLRAQDLDAIRDATNKSWALGDDTFLGSAQARCGRPVTPRKSGRPRKDSPEIGV